MLNADMCLYKNLTLVTKATATAPEGSSTCTFSGTKACPVNPTSYQTAQQYAANNTKW
jgi:hypothetical protein